MTPHTFRADGGAAWTPDEASWPPAPLPNFSPREREIIGCLLEAKAIKEISSALGLTVNTVKDYIKTIYQKAQVHSARALVVRFYLERPAAAAPLAGTLADSIQRLNDSPTAAAVTATLLQASRVCTGARQAVWFDLVPEDATAPGDAAVAAPPGGPDPNLTASRGITTAAGADAGEDAAAVAAPSHWLRPLGGGELEPAPSAWSRALQQTGYFQQRLPGGAILPPPFRRDALGLAPEMIGVGLRSGRQPGLLLLSAPTSAGFDATALPSARILACMAERELRTRGGADR